MPHIWVRAEPRENEDRVGLTPEGAATLRSAGFDVTVEQSTSRAIAIDGYRAAGCAIAPEGSWPDAPRDAFIFGLKELPEDDTPLPHRHIMFGHAFKGQHSGRALLRRFANGGGQLFDLEYLTDETGRRVAAFGYWAGFAGAAVTLKAWADQQSGTLCGRVTPWPDKAALLEEVGTALKHSGRDLPKAIVIGAKGRVGTGASDLCALLNVPVTAWDMEETAHGGPFPQILEHEVFLNCIFARPGTPVFVGPDAMSTPRRLTAIGDIACDPDSDYNPIPIYDRATGWAAPALRVHEDPPMDIMAIDNLPSLLPRESSEDFAAQLLPHLSTLDRPDAGIWGRAAAIFDTHIRAD